YLFRVLPGNQLRYCALIQPPASTMRHDHLRRLVAVVDAAASGIRLVTRFRTYRRGLARMVVDPAILGGEPVFVGTRIAVRHVGALARRGVPEAELLADFPSLNAADIKFARIFVGMKPPPGRPRRRLIVRSGSA